MGCGASTAQPARRIEGAEPCDDSKQPCDDSRHDIGLPALEEQLRIWGVSPALPSLVDLGCTDPEDLHYFKEDDIEKIQVSTMCRRKLWAKIQLTRHMQPTPPSPPVEPANRSGPSGTQTGALSNQTSPTGKAARSLVNGNIRKDEAKPEQLGSSTFVPQAKPVCVISYRTADQENLGECMQLVEELGFQGWNGSMVVAGNEDWMTQWIDEVERENTPVVVFLLSQDFVQSDACDNEFFWVFNQPHLRWKALPIMLEEFELPKKYRFMLMNCNYVHGFRDGWEVPFEQALREKMISRGLHVQHSAMPLFSDADAEGGDGAGAVRPESFEERLAKEVKLLHEAAGGAKLVGLIGSTNFKYSKSGLSKQVCQTLGRRLAALEAEDEDGRRTSVALVTGGCSGIGAVTAEAFHAARMESGRGEQETSTFAVLPKTDPEVSRYAGVMAPMAIDGKRVWVPPSDGSETYETRHGGAGMFRSMTQRRSMRNLRPLSAGGHRPGTAGSRGSVGSGAGEKGFAEWPAERYGRTVFFGASDKERKRFLSEALPILVFIEGGPGAMLEAVSAHAKGHIVIPVGCLGGGASDFAKDNHKKIKKIIPGDEFAGLFDLVQQCSLRDDEDAPGADDEVHRLLSVDETGEEGVGGPGSLTVRELADKVMELLRLAIKTGAMADHGIAHTAAGGFDLNGWQGLAEQPEVPLTVLPPNSPAALGQFVEANGGNVVLIDGHGTRNEYKGMQEDDFRRMLQPVVERLDELYNSQEQKASQEHQWVAIYGGDPYEPDKAVDASYIVKVLREHFNVKIVATQVDLYGTGILEPASEGGPGKKMVLKSGYSCLQGGAVMLYPTEKRKNLAGQDEVMYGGLDDHGNPCGATRLWFHKDMKPFVKAHLVMGGGVIALQNAKICLKEQKRVLYIPCAAKIVLEDKQKGNDENWYGQVHDMLADSTLQQALTHHCWRRVLMAPAIQAELLTRATKLATWESDLMAREEAMKSGVRLEGADAAGGVCWRFRKVPAVELCPFIELMMPRHTAASSVA